MSLESMFTLLSKWLKMTIEHFDIYYYDEEWENKDWSSFSPTFGYYNQY